MVRINIAGVVFDFLDLNEQVSSFLQHKYKLYIDSYNNLECHLCLRIHIMRREIVSFSDKLIMGLSIENDKYVLNAKCDGQIFGRADLCLSLKTCDIYLASYNEGALDLFISLIWRMVSVFCGRLLLHSSAIILEERAILFCGHSGAGKSTILNLVQQDCLTDEMACIYLNDEHVPVFQSIPWRSCSHDNVLLPIHTVYILEKSQGIYSHNVPIDMARILLPKFFYFNLWVNGSRDIAKCVLDSIVQRVSVKILGFNLDESKRLQQCIEGNVYYE